ncbi:MAG: WG repeat-containing protein [Coriobacteriia bacterium]|nr:WG repeat-containing protein [Coriobacteriia bacterium]
MLALFMAACDTLDLNRDKPETTAENQEPDQGQEQAQGQEAGQTQKTPQDQGSSSLVSSIEVALPPTYEDANAFVEGLVWVKLQGKWGALDKELNQVIDFLYDEAQDFSEGRAAVCVGGKWGFIDATGKEVTKMTYIEARSFSEGFAAVRTLVESELFGELELWTYVDKEGKEPFRESGTLFEGNDFHDGVTVSRRYISDTGLMQAVPVNAQGQYVDVAKAVSITSGEASEGYRFSEGLAPVFADGGEHHVYGYIDVTGKIVVKPQYDFMVSNFREGLAVVRFWGPKGQVQATVIDKTGAELSLQYPYSDITDFSEGYAFADATGVGKDDDIGWAIIDSTGAEIVPPIFFDVRDFSEGKALVEFKNEYRFIDTSGVKVFSLKGRYEGANSFHDGVATVWLNEKVGCVNAVGREIIEPKYDGIQSFQEGYAAMLLDGKVGFLKITG